MKNQLLLLLLFASILCTSCRTAATFESPNNIGNVRSLLYLKDGRIINGYLSINTEYKKNDKISIQQDVNKRPLFFKLKNVKATLSVLNTTF